MTAILSNCHMCGDTGNLRRAAVGIVCGSACWQDLTKAYAMATGPKIAVTGAEGTIQKGRQEERTRVAPIQQGGEHRAEVAFRLEESVLYNAIKGALDAFETGEKDSRALFESKITDLIWTVERDRDAVKKTIKQTRNMLAVLELKNYEIMHGSVKQWQAMMADEFLRTSSPAVRKWKKDWLDKLDAQWSGIWGFYDDLKLKNEQFIRNVMQPLEDIETRWAALRAQAMEHVEAEEQKVIAVLEAAHATRVEKLIRDFEAVPVLGLRAVGEYQQQASAIALKCNRSCKGQEIHQ
jgi:hypothetical protein